MSMFDMMFGKSKEADAIVGMIGLDPEKYVRFRDAWCEHLPDGSYRLVVLTRCGGNNRSLCDWSQIRSHAHYESDQDWDFDETYSFIYFRFPDHWAPDAVMRLVMGEPRPEQWQILVELVKRRARPERDLTAEFHAMMEQIRNGPPEELVQKFEPLKRAIEQSVENAREGKSTVILVGNEDKKYELDAPPMDPKKAN